MAATSCRVLILQQMLLIGASLLTVVALAQPAGGAFASVLGRDVAHLTIYLPALGTGRGWLASHCASHAHGITCARSWTTAVDLPVPNWT